MKPLKNNFSSANENKWSKIKEGNKMRIKMLLEIFSSTIYLIIIYITHKKMDELKKKLFDHLIKWFLNIVSPIVKWFLNCFFHSESVKIEFCKIRSSVWKAINHDTFIIIITLHPQLITYTQQACTAWCLSFVIKSM